MRSRNDTNDEIVVVGGGLSGSTIARRLAEAGRRVRVIEKNDHVAGLCRDFINEYGITVQAFGPHIFHTNDRGVWEFLRRFAEFHAYEHKVLSSIGGRLFPFPINRKTLEQFFGVELDSADVKSFLAEQVKKSRFRTPPVNFRDGVVSRVGDRLYSAFFEQYTAKQWGKSPEALSAELADRIPVRENDDDRYFSDAFQGLPSKGYTALIANLLDHENIVCQMGVDFFKIKESLAGLRVVFTGELDRYFDYRYERLEYRSLDFEFKTHATEYYQPVAVVNYPGEEEWTRITEFKHFLDQSSAHTTVCIEYPRSAGCPCYIVPTVENFAKREKYAAAADRLEKKGECFFAGRLAEYRYYNMDQAVASALKKADAILETTEPHA